MGDKLNVSTAAEYSEEELIALGGAINVVRANPARVRRAVLLFRLKSALGYEGADRLDDFTVGTNRVLESRLEIHDEATWEDRLAALGREQLGEELETLVIQWWKANGRGPK